MPDCQKNTRESIGLFTQSTKPNKQGAYVSTINIPAKRSGSL